MRDATITDEFACFSVYNHTFIPAYFGDPEAEYDSLMNGVAMCDVAAQRQVEISGPDAAQFIQYLTTRDISKTKVGLGIPRFLVQPQRFRQRLKYKK
jgi:glycine cleavage system aminomethyltransferase T